MSRKTQFEIAYRCTSRRSVRSDIDGERSTESVSDVATSGNRLPPSPPFIRPPPRMSAPAACSLRLGTTSFGVDPVPSSSSTSSFDLFRTTLREGAEAEADDVLEYDGEARDPDDGGGTSEDNPTYSASSSDLDRSPIFALDDSLRGVPLPSSAPTSANTIVHAAPPPFPPRAFHVRWASTREERTLPLLPPSPPPATAASFARSPSSIRSPGMTTAWDVWGC